MMTSTHLLETLAPSQKSTRWFLKTVSAVATLLIVWAVAGLFLYVAPQADSPKHADVLFVLGPPDQRMEHAEELMKQGYAPTLAVSVPLGKDGRFDAPICGSNRPYRVICFNPEPFTTQGEARALSDLSLRYGWRSADVLTAQFHLARARVILDRCYAGDLTMVADRRRLPLFSASDFTGSWIYQYMYQSAAFVKVAVNPGC
ncbi:YdcF family protein [Arthrobacter sp. 92]|uniref:YdcF family protein n=1 Tax=Arthrobacter sp. 92 TaxID=3418175 RepID=UPI003D055652